MKTKLIFFILLLSSISGFAQFTIKGVVIEDSTSKSYYKYINCNYITIYGPDNLKIRKQLDSNYCFEVSLQQNGKYIIDYKPPFQCGITRDTMFLEKDTSIVVTKTFPLAYEQPCRNYYKRNDYIFNIPLYHVFRNFEDMQLMAKKINLPDILKESNIFSLRIWKFPAFEYGGGTVFEITKTKNNNYQLNIIKFVSIYNESRKAEISDTIPDDIRNIRAVSNSIIKIEKNWFTENRKNYLDQFIKSKDFCITMTCNDYRVVVDGVSYVVELKINNNYALTDYNNPEITGKYDQIDSFLKIMEILKKRTQNQNR